MIQKPTASARAVRLVEDVRRGAIVALMVFACVAGGVRTVAAAVSAEVLAAAFPGADRVGEFAGLPPAAPVYRQGLRIGYLLSSRDVVRSVGFSGKPIDILVGLRDDGVIAGAVLLEHSEQILLIGVPEAKLYRFVGGFVGINVIERTSVDGQVTPTKVPDAITGASISTAAIEDGILRSARLVARARGLMGAPRPTIRADPATFTVAGWQDLIADGSIVRLTLDQAAGGAIVGARRADALFIDLYAALITPRRVGRNLMGRIRFDRLRASMGIDGQAIMIAANGPYSFKGTDFLQSGLFDRVQIVQGAKTIRLTTKDLHLDLQRPLTPDAPDLREIGIFVMPNDQGFDPLADWRLELLVADETTFGLEVVLPDRYRPAKTAAAGEGEWAAPLWLRIWRERSGRIVITSLALVALTAILMFQDALARRQRLYRAVRLGFLGFTLVWLGWYAGGQLSVTNVITSLHSLLTEFQWENFLIDPLIFILWAYVAVTLLFWGRGVFCGWLCPFGALQELLNEAARKLKVPQISVPFVLHKRLWAIKYIVLVGLFAVSLHSITLAMVGAEVEPFKTAISLHFVRHWPFVAYVAVLLAAGLFIERFYCRYLCPLGAALAIPARLRLFDWLKRREQCGRDCKLCAVRCQVQAIHPDGAINPYECTYCLTCQANYYDNTVCPPLVIDRKQQAARGGQLR